MYWTDGCGGVSKVAIGGGPVVALTTGATPCPGGSGHLIAVDGSHAYYLVVGAGSFGVWRVGLDGSGATELVVDGDVSSETAVAVDATHVLLGNTNQLWALSK